MAPRGASRSRPTGCLARLRARVLLLMCEEEDRGGDQGVPAGSGRGARREWGPGEGRGRAALAGPPWLRAERGRGEEGGGPFALGRKEAG